MKNKLLFIMALVVMAVSAMSSAAIFEDDFDAQGPARGTGNFDKPWVIEGTLWGGAGIEADLTYDPTNPWGEYQPEPDSAPNWAFFQINGSNGSAIHIDTGVLLEANTPYALGFYAASRSDMDPLTGEFKVQIWDGDPTADGVLVDEVIALSPTTAGEVVENAWTLTSGSTVTGNLFLRFEAGASASAFEQPLLDSVVLEYACPPAATLIAPSNGAIDVDEDMIVLPAQVTFEWLEPCTFTATSYDLEYRIGDPNFLDTGTVLVPAMAAPTTSHLATLANDATYFWRITSTNGVDTAISGTSSFTTIPAYPVVTDPTSVTVPVGATVTLTVEHQSAATYLWFEDDVAIGTETAVAGTTITLDVTVTVDHDAAYHCEVYNVVNPPTDPHPEAVSAQARVMAERLIAHWDFDDTLVDTVDGWAGVYTDPNALNDPQAGNEVYDDNSISGRSMKLEADELIVLITDSEDFFNFYPQGLTISTWVNTSTDGWGGIVCKQERGQISGEPWAGWGLARSPGNASAELRGVSGLQGGGSLADSQWHLVTMTYDGIRLTLYVDGQQANQSGELTAIAATNIHPVVIGAEREDGFTPYDGLIDELTIYNYALDPYTIANDYVAVMTTEAICVDGTTGLEFDVSGPEGVPDCTVDLYDFATFAATWLNCNRVAGIDSTLFDCN